MASTFTQASLPWVLSLLALGAMGCGGDDAAEPCAGVTCSSHGICADSSGQASCICDPGYHPEALACVATDPACEGVVCDDPLEICVQGACTLAPGRCREKGDCSDGQVCDASNQCVGASADCSGVDCSGHGQCVSGYGQAPQCACDPGWNPSADGLDCVLDDCGGVTCEAWESCVSEVCEPQPGRCNGTSDCETLQECNLDTHTCEDLPDPCEGVTCSGHGVCSRDDANEAVCNCEHGYQPDGTACAVDPDPVNWCAVWYPKSFVAHVGDPETPIYGRIYQPGMTEQASAQPSIHAQIGYTSAQLTYPVVTTDVTWVDSTFNISGAGDYGNDHEYMGAIPSTEAGQLNYLYRFSVNGGESWTYCSTDGVIDSAGYTPGTATISGDDPSDPVLELVAPPTLGADSYSFQVRYTPGQTGAAYDATQSEITLNGQDVTVAFDDASGVFDVSATGVGQGKYGYLFRVKDTEEHGATLFVPFWLESDPFSWKDATLYQILTDRFVNGNPANDDPVGSPVEAAGDWQGGDFAGVAGKIEDGYFSSLGVNAIWISSPILNTGTHEPGKGNNTGHEFSAYHAYWPVATGWTHENPLAGISSPIEHHFGTEAELRTLVETAHQHGIRVLVDFVPNHVHTDAPLYQQHQNDANWWHLPYDDCGVNNGWDDRRFTCWFDPFLPDFNCSNPEVRKVIVDHAIWLIQEFNLDGFRVDATKHVVPDILIDLRTRIDQEISTTGLHFYMVGETLTSNDAWVEEITGADRLDGSVNDPLHYNLVGTFLTGWTSPTDFDGFLAHDETVWTNHYADTLMVNFLGSHDTPRAISIANGDDTNAIWSNRPQTPTTEAPFQRLRMAQTFLLTYRSIPVLYMGDELGMPGASDPDNRRMMIFGSELAPYQTATLEHARALGQVRQQHEALRRGDRVVLEVDGQTYVYARKQGSDVVVVAFNTSTSDQTRSVDVSAVGVSGTLTDAETGGTVTVSGGHASLSLPPLTSAVYVP